MFTQTLFRPVALFAACSLLHSAPSQALIDDSRFCDFTDGLCATPGNCYTGEFAAWLPPEPTAGYCWHEAEPSPYTMHSGPSPAIRIEYMIMEPPESPQIACANVGPCTLSCSAWPIGVGYTYQWSAQGVVQFDPQPQPHESTVLVTLHNHMAAMINVAVVAANGQSATTSWGVIPNSSCFPY